MTLFLGYILDLLIGDPQGFPHPVRFIGMLIEKLEKTFRPKFSKNEFLGGMLLSIAVIITSFMIPAIILTILYSINLYLGIIIEVIFCYQIISTKALKDESMKVYYELEKGDIAGARKYLSYIVGRDTKELSEEKIIKAAVETVAENTSDGIIAPMIFMAIGGVPLGFLYKAINTLDSMIGYKNEKYFYFGKFAAILDDVVNFIPARLSAGLMLLAGRLLKLDLQNGVKIYKRDKNNHLSPNSAHTEAVCAGLLRIQLGGGSYYFGKYVHKETIGDDIRNVEKEDIKRVNKLLYVTSFIGIIIFTILRITIIGGIK